MARVSPSNNARNTLKSLRRISNTLPAFVLLTFVFVISCLPACASALDSSLSLSLLSRTQIEGDIGQAIGLAGTAMSTLRDAELSSVLSSSSSYNKSDAVSFKEFELILRPAQGATWPPAECAANGEAVAQTVTDALGISNRSFRVIAKVFDTVVMLVNTTGLADASSGSRVNATMMAELIVISVNSFNTTTNRSDYKSGNGSGSGSADEYSIYDILGGYFVGRCHVYKSSLQYTPVKVPGYLRQPEQYDRLGFYVMGGFAGFCVILQIVYGIIHRLRFDMAVLKDSDEQSID